VVRHRKRRHRSSPSCQPLRHALGPIACCPSHEDRPLSSTLRLFTLSSQLVNALAEPVAYPQHGLRQIMPGVSQTFRTRYLDTHILPGQAYVSSLIDPQAIFHSQAIHSSSRPLLDIVIRSNSLPDR